MMARELIFPEKMRSVNPDDAKTSIRTMDDYIRYMTERIDYAFTNFVTKDNFLNASKIVADEIFAKNITASTINCDQLNGGTIKGQRIISKNGKFKLEKDGTLYAENAYIRGDIEASSVSSECMETIKLDAEEIFAEMIDTAELKAENITSGTIDSARIDADSLSSKFALLERVTFKLANIMGLELYGDNAGITVTHSTKGTKKFSRDVIYNAFDSFSGGV